MTQLNLYEENLFSQQLNKNKKAFSKAERRIIDYIVANPHEVIYLSLAELAERSQTSDVTIIRLCKKIDLRGFPELKIIVAQSLSTTRCFDTEEVRKTDTVETLVHKEFRNTINTLESTLEFLRIKNLEAASDALISANRIIIFGKGNSTAVAIDLQHKLLRLGLPTEMYGDSYLQYIAAANVKASLVVFAISHSGMAKSVINSIKIAKNNGARIITLTNYARSPIYDLSDIRLYTAFKEVPYSAFAQSSRIAQFMIVDVLSRVIAHKNHDYADNAYTNIKNALIGER